jgi:hypothetical protein
MFLAGTKVARGLALGISLMGAAIGAHTIGAHPMVQAASPTICVAQVGGGSTVTLQGKAITPAIRQAAAAAPSGACVPAPTGFVAPAAPAAVALPAASGQGKPVAAAPAAAALPTAGGRAAEAALAPAAAAPVAAAAPTTSGRPVS